MHHSDRGIVSEEQLPVSSATILSNMVINDELDTNSNKRPSSSNNDNVSQKSKSRIPSISQNNLISNILLQQKPKVPNKHDHRQDESSSSSSSHDQSTLSYLVVNRQSSDQLISQSQSSCSPIHASQNNSVHASPAINHPPDYSQGAEANDEDTSQNSVHPEEVSPDFPYSLDGTIQLTYLPIDILILLAVHLNVHINKTANSLQNRQRLSFIKLVNDCELSYGYKTKALEFISLLEYNGRILPVVYEPSIEINLASNTHITELNLPPTNKQFSHDIVDPTSSINIHITLVATQKLQDTCITAVNNHQPIKDVISATANDAPCFKTAITILKPITSIPSNNYGANQILTLMLSSTNSHNVQPNLNLLDTTNKCLSLLYDMHSDLQNYTIPILSSTKYISHTSLSLTITKVESQMEYLELHRQCLARLTSSPSSQWASPMAVVHKESIPRAALFSVDDLCIIQECTSLNVQFCIREKQHSFHRYILLANEDNNCLSKQQIIGKLARHIICCDQSTDGNAVGLLSLCVKINVAQSAILSGFASLVNRMSTVIARLPALNPTMRTQQIAANQLACRLSNMIETPLEYTHICIHGIPNSLLLDRKLLSEVFCRLDDKNPGIGKKLHIPDSNRYGPSIRVATTGLLIHKILVSTPSTTYYDDGYPIIVIELRNSIVTPIPWRTTMMELPVNGKLVLHLLAATFITADLAAPIISSQEILAARPLPQEYPTPACVALMNMYQPKTSYSLHPIIMSSDSKVQLQSKNNSVLSHKEIVCVMIITDQLDEHALHDLRNKMKISNHNSDATVHPVPSIRFQVAPTMRSMSLTAYTPSMTTLGDHKYIIFRKYNDTLKASSLCELIQLHLPTISHHFVLAFFAPLFNKDMSIIIITDSKADINMLMNELRSMILNNHLSKDERPYLETAAMLPGFYTRNTLLLNKIPTIVPHHPKETSSFSVVTSKSSNSSSSDNTRYSNKQPNSSVNLPPSSTQSTLTSYYSTLAPPPAPPPHSNNNV